VQKLLHRSRAWKDRSKEALAAEEDIPTLPKKTVDNGSANALRLPYNSAQRREKRFWTPVAKVVRTYLHGRASPLAELHKFSFVVYRYILSTYPRILLGDYICG